MTSTENNQIFDPPHPHHQQKLRIDLLFKNNKIPPKKTNSSNPTPFPCESHKCMIPYQLNPFLANVPTLHPLKTPENQSFSDVFRGYKMGTLFRNGLMLAV